MYPGIPALTLRAATTATLLNILLPGVGTGLLARSGGERQLWWKAVFQLLTAILVVGWLWALVTSAKAMANAREAAHESRQVPVADGPPLWR